MFSSHSHSFDVKVFLCDSSQQGKAVAKTVGQKIVQPTKNLSLACFSFVAISNHKNALPNSIEKRGRRGLKQVCDDKQNQRTTNDHN